MAIINRRAKFDYEFLDKYEAGIVLNGMEVKAIRAGKVNISSSHAKFVNGELYLINAVIDTGDEKQNSRTRKLLLHKAEMRQIGEQLLAKKLTLIPVKLYNMGRNFKLELALARSKKKFQKKEKIRRADLDRETQRELKNY